MIYAPIYVPFRLIGFSKYRFDNPMTIRECLKPVWPYLELFAHETSNP